MNKLLNSKVGKIALGAVFALALIVVGAARANAYTSYAQMNADTGGFRFNMNLSTGMTHSDVAMLQRFLNIDPATSLTNGSGNLAGHDGYETTYFGPKTKAAVMAFQVKYSSEVLAPVGLNGLNPQPTGFFGPMSRAKANALLASGVVVVPPPACPAGYSYQNGACVQTAACPAGYHQGASNPAYPGVVFCEADSTTTPPSGLSGGAGSVQEYKLLASPSNSTEVGEDENDVKVIGISIEADDGSDIALTAVKVQFCDDAAEDALTCDGADNNSATADQDFDEYATEVAIWLGSTEIARVDASEFNDSNDWTKTISLASGAIIRKGDIGNLYVTVSSVGNLDSGNAVGDSWDVDVTQVRFVDAQGAIISEDPGLAARTFSFETLATSGNVNLKVALGTTSADDDINDAHIIDVSDTNATNDVKILSFTLKAEGNSDITVSSIPVLITTTEAAGTDFDEPGDVITQVTLWRNGVEIDSQTLNQTGATDSETVVFNDFADFTINAGSTDKFTVSVDLIETNSVLDDGDTVKAEITSTERDAIDAEDESGADLCGTPNFDCSGTALGEAHAVYDNGIKVTFVSQSVSKDSDATPDQGTFKITFRVETFGDGDAWIDTSCSEDDNNALAGVNGEGVEFTVNNATNAGCNVSAATTDSDDTANAIQVAEGTSRNITLSVLVDGPASFVNVALNSINWMIKASAPGATESDQFYTFNLNEFKTGNETLSAS